ncbi:MAG: hypothetical protein KDJ39_09465 [Gammaproteobacteria bacterium]|nr:hypothetical protein [Gammaproteobacteria bacterium]
MKQRLAQIDCDAEQAAALARAVDWYAAAAYPPGGSECAQVARETLRDAATVIGAHAGGRLVVRKRLLPQLRAALTWCLSQEGPPGLEWPAGLADVLDNATTSSAQQRQDRGTTATGAER